MVNEFKGIWPAMFTPVKVDGAPSLEELEKLVELLISQNLDGIYILGSTGQGVLFTEKQRKQITEVVCEIAAGRIPVIVQVGALTTEESVKLARHAEKQGVAGISSVGPIYYAYTADMALEHYTQIAKATALPFFPYQLGHDSIPGDAIGYIKKLLEIPNVAGMKLTTDKLINISTIYNYAGDTLKLFSGDDELFCHASLCGTVGAIGTTYNLWGRECKYVLEEFTSGNYELAKRFMLSFQNVIQFILPNIWSFMERAMFLKYNIEIGHSKAPLGNTHKVWNDKEVFTIIDKIQSLTEYTTEKHIIIKR